MNKTLFNLCFWYPQKGLFWISICSHFPVALKFSVKSNFSDIFILEEESVKMTKSNSLWGLFIYLVGFCNVRVTLVTHTGKRKNGLEKLIHCKEAAAMLELILRTITNFSLHFVIWSSFLRSHKYQPLPYPPASPPLPPMSPSFIPCFPLHYK